MSIYVLQRRYCVAFMKIPFLSFVVFRVYSQIAADTMKWYVKCKTKKWFSRRIVAFLVFVRHVHFKEKLTHTHMYSIYILIINIRSHLSGTSSGVFAVRWLNRPSFVPIHHSALRLLPHHSPGWTWRSQDAFLPAALLGFSKFCVKSRMLELFAGIFPR